MNGISVRLQLNVLASNVSPLTVMLIPAVLQGFNAGMENVSQWHTRKMMDPTATNGHLVRKISSALKINVCHLIANMKLTALKDFPASITSAQRQIMQGQPKAIVINGQSVRPPTNAQIKYASRQHVAGLLIAQWIMCVIVEVVFKQIQTIHEEDTVMLKINVTLFMSAKNLNVFGNDTIKNFIDLFDFQTEKYIIQNNSHSYNNFVSVLQLNSESKKRNNMFDENKVKQLQNKSHVRGKLNKQFYSSEQEELQKKRKQMKHILDQQVEERRRQKDRQKLQNQRKMQQEQQKIKAYYAQIQDRQKKVSMGNNSGHGYLQNSNTKNFNGSKNNGSGVYESRASNFNQENNNYNNLHLKQNGSNYRSKSKTQYQNDSGDIPVMPLMQSLQKDKQKNYHIHQKQKDKQKEKDRLLLHKNSAGNIPLLQLTLDEQKREKKKSKRNPTKMNEKQKEKEKNEKIEKKDQKQKIKQRKQTIPDEQFYVNSRQQTQFKEVFGDLNEQLEEQNKQLKKQLKKKQQAISLLMGAVKSNAKFDKFRVQAEKILHGQNSLDTKLAPVTHNQNGGRKQSKNGHYQANDSKQKQSMFPRLKLKHQSIMHDYMFGSARRAQVIKSKTFK